MSFCVEGYSGCIFYYIGLTSKLYAFCLVVVEPMFRFPCRKLNVLFPFPHMLLMWFVQLRSDVNVQPRFFALFTGYRV